MNEASIELGNPAYIEQCKTKWSCAPKEMHVIEFFGQGDPFFGGSADDRPLGKNGCILDRPCSNNELATFTSIEEAHHAALSITNRRKGSVLGVVPRWR